MDILTKPMFLDETGKLIKEELADAKGKLDELVDIDADLREGNVNTANIGVKLGDINANIVGGSGKVESALKEVRDAVKDLKNEGAVKDVLLNGASVVNAAHVAVLPKIPECLDDLADGAAMTTTVANHGTRITKLEDGTGVLKKVAYTNKFTDLDEKPSLLGEGGAEYALTEKFNFANYMKANPAIVKDSMTTADISTNPTITAMEAEVAGKQEKFNLGNSLNYSTDASGNKVLNIKAASGAGLTETLGGLAVNGFEVLRVAPTSANTDNAIKVVILPKTDTTARQSGYIYFYLEA